MINSGLKNLAKVANRHPELGLTICPRIQTQAQRARQEHHGRFGPAFDASLEQHMAIMRQPTDASGRPRKVLESVDKHAAALRRAAGICVAAGVPIATISDLLSPAARDAIIVSYGSPKTASGGRNFLLKILAHVAKTNADYVALGEIKRQQRKVAKPKDAMTATALVALSRYDDLRVRDQLLGSLGAVIAELEHGWPTKWPLRRLQAAIALLLSYYLIATPQFIRSITFRATADRQTEWDPRPLLYATEAPHEPIEDRLPDKVVRMIDLCWAQMPEPLRRARTLFVTDHGDPMAGSALTQRCEMLIDELNIGLTPLGFVDLAVLDMVWARTMTDTQMAHAARFGLERNFLKRYKILVDSVKTRLRRNPRRPGSSR